MILYDGVKDGVVMKYRLLTVRLLSVFNQNNKIFVMGISVEWEREASRGYWSHPDEQDNGVRASLTRA